MKWLTRIMRKYWTSPDAEESSPRAPEMIVDPPDEAVEDYRATNPLAFTEPLKFKLDYQSAPDAPSAHLSLETEFRNPQTGQVLRVSFVNVGQFNLGDFGPRSALYPPAIESFRKAQWEGVEYYVSCEHGEYSFYCEDFSFILIPVTS